MLRRLLLSFALLAFAAPAAWAQADRDRDPRADRDRRSLSDSVRRIERETGGEVIRAGSVQRNGRESYRFKVLTPEGRMRVLHEDPRRQDEARRRADQDRGQTREPARPARDDD